MEFTEKNDKATVSYKGKKANVETGTLPELSLAQLEILDLMKDTFGHEPITAEEVANYQDFTGIDKLTKASAIMKNMVDKGYVTRTQKERTTAWVLNQKIFDIK